MARQSLLSAHNLLNILQGNVETGFLWNRRLCIRDRCRKMLNTLGESFNRRRIFSFKMKDKDVQRYTES